ncbi:MAG: hypothetical protein COV31_01850 [Candidatus Yanofskybacteria bacterium CG10_big_fil_rev_8_21_14_0_10_46_23]|uniref:Uncharacterized protein n=1 Tax=Candidatus Yanofskybacteria bacterium CG10_big_fil_rev_8_21_14_0_10_46_23 TaxID=1975098 RepID=A0A2H0R450_9BACT|nr:MAG: hypothetical protein COV31_01850 [Candidatus Yanofskybacteria bacterium CG10_big_fil_rev_8_21_14_0_10_46_23]
MFLDKALIFVRTFFAGIVGFFVGFLLMGLLWADLPEVEFRRYSPSEITWSMWSMATIWGILGIVWNLQRELPRAKFFQKFWKFIS